MCLCFIAIEQNPEVPLLLLFNRDEGYERPRTAAHWWPEENFIAGRDELKGGTWAAFGRDGKFAMLTFIRGPREQMTPQEARGNIVPAWMRSSQSASSFLEQLSQNKNKYLGYNLVLGDGERTHHYNNHSDAITELRPGIHGVSNANLNTPWFKVTRGITELQRITLLPAPEWTPNCLELMADKTLAPDEEVQDTGLSYEREKRKSSLFICTPGYGTLATSAVTYRADGSVSFLERSFDASGGLTREVTEQFQLQ